MTTIKTFGNSREAGLLVPVFSLPSFHGIGDFGKSAYELIDIIKEMGFAYWQILPINPVGFGNSPYQPYSSFAGDEIYINLTKLQEDGLLGNVPHFHEKDIQVDYLKVRPFKEKYLREAYKNFKPTQEYETFINKAFWLKDYAHFIAMKKLNENKMWLEWDKHEASREEVNYQYFIQYIFYKQWKEIKVYANEKGIQIIGDMPIYVGLDSSDVYSHRKCFLLDETGHPTSVAGVPPDYFSKDGQLWGNPLYDWDYLKQTDYKFWIERLKWNQEMFDIIRIDHFRAFDTYWKIPADSKTAKNGQWVLGPAYDFFDSLFRQIPDIQLIAEDLGDLRDEVLTLRDHYHLLGMRIGQFSLGDDMKPDYQLPEYCIAYTGTHDNSPIQGWFDLLPNNEKKHVLSILKSLNIKNKTISQKMIHFVLNMPSILAIIQVQDLLEVDNSGRINLPSTISNKNWSYKMKSLKPLKKKIISMKNYLINSNRKAS